MSMNQPWDINTTFPPHVCGVLSGAWISNDTDLYIYIYIYTLYVYIHTYIQNNISTNIYIWDVINRGTKIVYGVLHHDYEGTYNIGDVLNCMVLERVNWVIYYNRKYDKHIIVDKVIDGSDIFINGKFVDDFNDLDKNYIYALNVSATQQRLRIIMEQKNKINDSEARLSRLEAIIISSSIVDGTTNNGTYASNEKRT